MFLNPEFVLPPSHISHDFVHIVVCSFVRSVGTGLLLHLLCLRLFRPHEPFSPPLLSPGCYPLRSNLGGKFGLVVFPLSLSPNGFPLFLSFLYIHICLCIFTYTHTYIYVYLGAIISFMYLTLLVIPFHSCVMCSLIE